MTYPTIFIFLAAVARAFFTHAIAELFRTAFAILAPDAPPISCIVISVALAAIIIEIAVIYWGVYAGTEDNH